MDLKRLSCNSVNERGLVSLLVEAFLVGSCWDIEMAILCMSTMKSHSLGKWWQKHDT